MTKEPEIFHMIEETIKLHPNLDGLNKKGLCRVWTREAIGIIKELKSINHWEIEIEAREVEIEPGLDHTFLRIIVQGFPAFILDGTGAGFYDPYFGPETEASHLQNSKIDWIHHLLLASGD